ncbi:hypothetical protein ANN_17677 [Periplaneta americana]|uniref:Uncharacterized protein n=1 Tax=Periplaneta americana TaxID=6978 RepID=A0ABQ8STR0_PERAM|nr:hypothetical protein ANN_17677 [Periplaneta americana]
MHCEPQCARVKLDVEDYAARRAMCYDVMQDVNNKNIIQHILFSNEATFHICGKVNKDNCRIWGNESPHVIYEWQRDTPKVNVCLGLTKATLYGPFMFAEGTITGNTYLGMLTDFLEPQLEQGGIVYSVVFQHDAAPPDFALTVRAYLNQRFPNGWIGRGSSRVWPLRSPDLTPLDFFAWGFIKAKVCKRKYETQRT